MDLSTGLPFWLVKNGLPYDYPQLAKNINCDVVILGGGITAAINAFILVEAGQISGPQKCTCSSYFHF